MTTTGNVLDLSSLSWTLGNGVNVSNVPASFPSQAHLDLYKAKIIGDPLYGENDYEQLWVQRMNWTYTSEPIKSLPLDNSTQTWLLFEGLDTFTYVTLCDKEVGSTSNQFRQYYFDVSSILHSCSQAPVLSLDFGSASKIVLQIANSSEADQEVNYVNSVDGQEFQGKIYARKEQNDFGWDWSPSFAPAGPWRSGSFVLTGPSNPVKVRNTLIDIYREGQMNNISPDQSKSWIFNASCDVVGRLPASSSIALDLVDASGKRVAGGTLQNVSQNGETITGSMGIPASAVELWWPTGLGNQNLYNATLTITDKNGSKLATSTRRVGFRTIVLNLNPISDKQISQGIAPGSNWHFEVNGHEIYAKGSNFVPPDVFWPRVNQTRIQHLFELVKNGNQNMLRVWSSGAYLPDFVYDLADEMGILLWSEFEFTDAEYPTNKTDLANYEAEAYYNVRRVNHHPSLALWAGGNELESIQLAYFFNADSPGYILKQYQQIFEELLIKCVYANSRSVSYIPSSTYNGYLSLNFSSVRPQTPRYLNSSGPNDLYADTDYYNYDASSAFDMSTYPIGRFADEFGFISMPSLQSWQEITTNDQLSNVESDIVVHRNRHTGGGLSVEGMSRNGLAQMTSAVPQWYSTPNKANHLANFSAWSYATQIFQADFYTSQIAFYRRGSGRPERQLGSLYWQLEDLWVAPTWSSIEANGRQKLLYHRAKDIYQPVIVYSYVDDATNELEVWVTSDLWSSASGVVHFELFDFNGKPITPPTSPSSLVPDAKNISSDGHAFSVPFKVGAINATQVVKIRDFHSLFPQPTINNSSSSATNTSTLANSLLRLSVEASANTASQNTGALKQYLHSSVFHPAPLKDAALPDPGLKLTHGTDAQDRQVFTVAATRAVAAWVELDYRTAQVQGYFEDNGFWLAKDENRTVRFVVWNDWTGTGAWVAGVTVRSLYDLTTP